MNKIDKFLIKYVLYALPLNIVVMLWGAIDDPDKLSLSEGLTRVVWDTLGFIFMFWMLISLYLSLKTVFSNQFRDKLLSKFTRVKERDEREVEISQNAARFSYFSTLAILLLFLFLSIFTVTIGRYPDKEMSKDKNGYVSIGMQFEAYNLDKISNSSKDNKGMTIVNYSGLPITHSALLLFIILWQVCSYHIIVKRKLYS